MYRWHGEARARCLLAVALATLGVAAGVPGLRTVHAQSLAAATSGETTTVNGLPEGPRPGRGMPTLPPVDDRRDSEPQSPDHSFTLVLGGDLGLNGSGQPLHPDGGHRHLARTAWGGITAGLAPLLRGDLVMANLESVVTDRGDLAANPKAFNFRLHPNGAGHLVDLGIDVLTIANNHSLDYGAIGLGETVRHLEALRPRGLAAFPGAGRGRDAASRPAVVERAGLHVAIAAIGIGGGGHDGGGQRPLLMSYHAPGDFTEVVGRLAATPADLRILGVHYGQELQVRPAAADVRRLRDQAVGGAGIDIIAGHHAHVAAGVQETERGIIFYGLGNLLHPGMQDMARFGICRDYGLLARVHLGRAGAGQRPEVAAVEAVALVDMHVRTTAMPPEAGRQRIEVLNHLAAGLDDAAAGARGIRFTPQADGSGLYCRPGVHRFPGRIGLLCRGWQPPGPAGPALSARLSSACGGVSSVAARDERARSARRVAATKPGATLFTSVFGF